MRNLHERNELTMLNILRVQLHRALRACVSIALLIFFATGTARAQGAFDWLQKVQLSGTYSFLRGKPDNANPDMNLSGASEALSYRIGWRFSAVAEAGEYRFTGLFPGLHSTMYTYLFGPRMAFPRYHRVVPFAQALVGGGRLDANSGGIFAGENAFAGEIGGGIDVPLRRHFSLRAVQADYLLTRYDSMAGRSATQNHVRISAGLLVRFGGE
jgi:hypothetical protein